MSHPDHLDDWVRLISEEEMPVFAHTARHVAGISAGADTSTNELARAVLLDSAMTARLLRLANSVYYNPACRRVTTVSRAIVMLGFETVRTIALSIAMVDTMLRGHRHERVVAEMACAFHGAVQAKALAARRGQPHTEEIFIATLLLRLGAMAFWCFPCGRDAAMSDALARDSDAERAERSVLHFSLAELTLALNREWSLSDLLAKALSRHPDPNQVECIEIGFQLATNAAQHGWQSPQTRHWISRAATIEHLPEAEATHFIYANVRDAIRAATDYGAEPAAQRIPLPPLTGSERPPASDTRPPAEAAGTAELQLQILRELSTMLAERADVSALLGMVLEGIYRGVAMDRVVLALITPDGQRLKARIALGHQSERLTQCFDIPMGERAPAFFRRILDRGEPLWLRREDLQHGKGVHPELERCLGDAACFVFPLSVAGRPRGLVYADRNPSHQPLDERSFDAFRHFCEQAVIGLSVMILRNGS